MIQSWELCDCGAVPFGATSDMEYARERIADLERQLGAEQAAHAETREQSERWMAEALRTDDLWRTALQERDGARLALATAQKRITELEEGEAAVTHILIESFAMAISGLADAAIIAQQPMDVWHVSEGIRRLGDAYRAEQVKITAQAEQIARLRESLKNGITTARSHHIRTRSLDEAATMCANLAIQIVTADDICDWDGPEALDNAAEMIRALAHAPAGG